MYSQGWNVVPLKKLFEILHTVPPDSLVGISMTGALAVIGPDGAYRGYIDLGHEERYYTAEETEALAAKNVEKVDETVGPRAADP